MISCLCPLIQQRAYGAFDMSNKHYLLTQHYSTQRVIKITRTSEARECPYVILLSFGLQAFYNPTPCPMKLTFRYIFYVELYSGVDLFSLIFRVRVRVSYRVRIRLQGLRLGLGLGIDNLKKYFKIFDRWRCKHVGHSLSTDACAGAVLGSKHLVKNSPGVVKFLPY